MAMSRLGKVATLGTDIWAYIIEQGLVPQLLLLLGVWGVALGLVVVGRDVPGWLQDGALTILGYFFHVAQTAVDERKAAKLLKDRE